METQVKDFRGKSLEDLLEDPAIKYASSLIRSGKLVGFPTETVYGLGASALDENAVKNIYKVKGRPQDNPIIVHISNMDMLESIVAEIPNNVKELCQRFWPGPLTLLFNKNENLPNIVTANLETVAIRMPSHPVALALIEKSGTPIAAPSANLSGFPSPTKAEHVYNDLRGRIPLIMDGGPCNVGVESTVIDLMQDPPIVLRPGGTDIEDLLPYIPNLKVFEKQKKYDKKLNNTPSSPGMKYRHYSPKAKVILFEGRPKAMESKLKEFYRNYKNAGKKVAIIHTQSEISLENLGFELSHHTSDKELIISLLDNDSRFSLAEVVAKGIFAALRDFDRKKVDIILVEGITEKERGLAVMNRLRKAADRIISSN